MNRKRLSIIALLLLVILAIPFIIASFKTSSSSAGPLQIENKKTKSGNSFTLFYQNDLVIDISLERPDVNDKNIMLCIAGAYTDLVSYKPDGIYINKGIVYNRDKINYTLGGAIKIIDGNCEIFPTHKGKLLNDSLISLVAEQKGSLFQQSLIIEKGTATQLKDPKSFQRRAIVKMKKNKTAVIESAGRMTLNEFTGDLLELGVTDALYTDMGAWDEGWYKQEGIPVIIGKAKTQTDKQSNWIVFKLRK